MHLYYNDKKLMCVSVTASLSTLRIVSIEEDVNAHENDGIDAAEARPEGIFSDAVNDGR